MIRDQAKEATTAPRRHDGDRCRAGHAGAERRRVLSLAGERLWRFVARESDEGEVLLTG